MPVRVRLLGRPRIEGAGQPCAQPHGRKSWGVLARVAIADRPLSRRVLADELFADADDPLGALRWALADLRRGLGLPGALRGDPLQLPPTEVWLDVRALGAGDLPAADIGGALLEGVDLPACAGFDSWLLLARSRTAARSREELRRTALELMAAGEAAAAVPVAQRAAALDPLDEVAQELFLHALVAAGHGAQATVHLARCTATLVREGLTPSPALRAAARSRSAGQRSGVRAGVVGRSLLAAGSAALSAGAADAGVETLRRAAEEAGRAADAALQVEVLLALGSALVHAVRGYDGEGAVVLHEALARARGAGRRDLAAEALRELAFVDVQAGRHASADRAVREAVRAAEAVGDDLLTSRVLAVQGMNEADCGRHLVAQVLLRDAAQRADRASARRQQAWALGVLARSLLLAGSLDAARQAAEQSVDLVRQERWHAFLPWPQALRAEVSARRGDWGAAQADAESAFALACELRDPCWEGMAGRALALTAAHAGDDRAARAWTADARARCDRVPDRYVWVSGYVGLADLEVARRAGPAVALAAADRLHRDAVRADLPEFLAWALVHQAELGRRDCASQARAVASTVDNPALQARALSLAD